MKLHFLKLLILAFTVFCLNACVDDSENIDDLLQDEKIDSLVIEDNSRLDTLSIIMENSASMRGYFQGKGEKSIRSVFIDLESSFINVEKEFFVANQVVSKKKNLLEIMGKGNLSKIYTGLKDGKSTKSDHELILKNCIKQVNDGKSVMLFTDGIYSMDGKSLDYVTGQIKKAYSLALNDNEVEVLIYKFTLPFEGTYYCEATSCSKSKNFNYDGKRPLYLFVFGKPNQINSIRKNKGFERIEKEYKPIYTRFFLTKSYSSSYSVLKPSFFRGLVSGDYGCGNREDRIQGLMSHTVSEATKNGGKTFQFAFAANFSDLLLDEAYFLTKENYLIEGVDYQIDSVFSFEDLEITKKNQIVKLFKKTDHKKYVFIVSSKEGAKSFTGNLKIGLKNIPSSLSKRVDSDCSESEIDSLNTITFSSLLKGISESYENLNDNKLLVELNFKIKIN